MALTKKEARIIADALVDAAEGIDRYLDDHFQEIDRPEYEFLNESFKTILRVAGFCTTAAVGLAIDALDNPAAELQGVIDRAKKKIKDLKEVDLVIRLVAGLADLAAGIMAKDPDHIVAAVTALGKRLEEEA